MTDFLAERNVPAAERSVQELVRRSDLAFSQFTEAAARATELHSAIAAAKGRAALGEEMQRQLEALQHRAHERSVGAFERLLSAVLHDVLPGEGSVKFDLAMKNNSTWLDVLLEKGGHLEDALEGNGGAVANVLSTGLRFAALARTKNRRVMVLDEPDCWVKPERIPAFVNVIAKVSTGFDFQSFFISHHDSELFQQAVNVIELGKDKDGKVCVKSESHVTEDWADDMQPGIRALELINIRRHEHTVLRFRPGATALIGENNLGKSTAILSSLKAVAYGESSDELLRHGCDEATIVLHLERGRRIVWNRKLKRSPVVLYKLYEGDELVAEGRPGKRNEAPEWVTAELGICRVDDLDVQLRNQKTPVFLLDDTASRRAQVLSIGRESGYLKLLMAEYEALKTEDRLTVRNGEAEFARLQWRLRAKPIADALPDLSARLESRLEALRAQAAATEKLRLGLGQLEGLQGRLARGRATVSALDATPAKPKVVDPTPCGAALGVLQRCAAVRRIAGALPLPPARPGATDPSPGAALVAAVARGARLRALSLPRTPELPKVQAPQELVRLGAAIRRGFTIKEVAGKITQVVELPRVLAPTALKGSLDVLQKSDIAVKGFKQEARTVETDTVALKGEEQALRGLLGDQCPVCGSHLPEQGFKHAH